MARNKKRKKNKGGSRVVKLKPDNYIKRVARKLPIYQCWIGKNWKEEGKTQVVVSRQKRGGGLLFGFYLVDIWCLGLKDTFYRNDLGVYEFEKLMEDFGQGYEAVMCEPNLAFNVIYGAIEYAEDLGFNPPKDFRVTQYILDDVEKIEYIDIEFGKNGKPFYVEGLDDNTEAVLRILEKNVGAGNFEFVSSFDSDLFDDDTDEEYDEENFYLIEKLLPEAMINAKIESFKDETQQGVLVMQFAIAREIIMRIGDDFALLEDYTEEFFEDILDGLLNFFGEDEYADEEEEERMFTDTARMMEVMIDRIQRHGGVDFLLKDDYIPYVYALDEAAVKKLSKEQFEEYKIAMFDGLDQDEELEILVQALTMGIIKKKLDSFKASEISEELKTEIEKEVVNLFMKSVYDKEAFEEDGLDLLKEVIKDTIARYDELKD